MRTDVRMALGIGGLLLAILVAYVLFAPATPEPPSPGDGGRRGNTVPTARGGRDVSGGSAVVSATTKPAPATRGTTAPAAVTSAAPGALLPVRPAPGSGSADVGIAPVTPAPAVPSANVGRGEAWDQLLRTGQLAVPAVGSRAGSSGAGAGAATAAGGARTHIVQSGETLSSIAQSAYGRSSLYPVIVRANPGIDPDHLHPGQVIKLPDLSQTSGPAQGESVTPSVPTKPAEGAGGTGSDAGSRRGGSRTTGALASASNTYRVQPGDNLSRIAVKLYGSRSRWQRIYEVNKETIGSNPGRLRRNMVLRLPEPPTVTLAR